MSDPKLILLLRAVPDPSYAPTSHRGSISIPAREIAVSSLARAIEHMIVFATDHGLGAGNLAGAGLVRRDSAPLCRVTFDGKLLAVDAEGLATGQRYRDPMAPPRTYRHLGEIVRALREDAELIRREVALAVGIAPETLRNLEMGRHAATGWTWHRLLQHPAIQDLPQIAQEAGFEVPGRDAPKGSKDPPD